MNMFLKFRVKILIDSNKILRNQQQTCNEELNLKFAKAQKLKLYKLQSTSTKIII